MDFFENDYFNTTRKFLLLIGQWPRDRSWRKIIPRAFISILTVSAFFVQIATLIRTSINLDFLLDYILPMVTCLMLTTKYCTSWKNTQPMQELLNRIEHEWNTLSNEAELEIAHRYAKIGKIYGLFYLWCVCVGLVAFMSMEIFPVIIAARTVVNGSAVVQLPFMADYFVDEEKYFYPIMLHIITVTIVSESVMGITDLLYINITLHTCGRYSILSYRLEHVFDDIGNSKGNTDTLDKKSNLSANIGRCVEYHKNIIEFVDILKSSLMYSYVIQLFLIVATLTGFILRIYQKLMLEKFKDAIGNAMAMMGILFAVFLNIYPGQMIIDSSIDVFVKAYAARWYAVPFKIQKLFLIILQRTSVPCNLSAANVASLSLPTLTLILQTSMSYFTVLYSLRS